MPLPAAAGRRLDDDRIAEALGGGAERRGRPAASVPVAGTTGTPAASIRARAATLSPMAAIASAGGPMKIRPADATARANPAFSARNP